MIASLPSLIKFNQLLLSLTFTAHSFPNFLAYFSLISFHVMHLLKKTIIAAAIMSLVLLLIIGLSVVQMTDSQADDCDCDNDYDLSFCNGIKKKLAV